MSISAQLTRSSHVCAEEFINRPVKIAELLKRFLVSNALRPPELARVRLWVGSLRSGGERVEKLVVVV